MKRSEHSLRYRYHINTGIYNKMLESQGYRCSVCLTDISGSVVNIDHCHCDRCIMPMAIRGLLCGKCNKALGLLSESPVVLRRAAEYLEAHVCGKES